MKKRKDGRYCKQVLIGYTADGKPRYKNIYGRTQAETIHAAELFRNELEKGVAVIGDNFILSEWSDRWLELYKSNVEYNTYKMYSNAVNKHIKPYLGHMNLKDIKTHHVQELLNILIKAEKFRTCGIVKLALSQIMNQACENEYIYKNPVKNVKIPKTSAAQKRALTEEELHWLHIANFTEKQKVIAKDITPHLFRHTYATRLYYAGVDIKTAQYLLGHSSIQMTLDIYTHLDGLQTETALQKLNAYSEKISQKSVNQ